jgi:DNA polymerase III delta prime subunit
VNGDVLIRKHKISVKANNEQVAFRCQQFFNQIINDELPKLYERIFHQTIRNNSYISINSLKIDLGVISNQDLKSNFIQIIEQKILNELQKQFDENPEFRNTGSPADDSSSEFEQTIQYASEKQQVTFALMFFFQNGNYPWWYKKNGRKTPAELLSDLTSNEQSTLFNKIITTCKNPVSNNAPKLVRRFISYLDRSACENFLEQIAIIYTEGIEKINLATLLKQRDELTRLFNISSKTFNREALYFILLHATKPDLFIRFVNSLQHSYPVAKETLKPEDLSPDVKILLTKKANIENLKPEKKKDNVPAQREIYIDNAGLILLHPFMPAYFNGLGLTDDNNEFRSAEAQAKAAILLYYLQCGGEDYKEWEMPLNKLLCGMDADDNILNDIKISEIEKGESRLLLTTVIEYWSALKGSGIEALQNTFFSREGKLSFKQDHWLLQVERTAVDVLLDRLPWGIGTIKLPWLKSINLHGMVNGELLKKDAQYLNALDLLQEMNWFEKVLQTRLKLYFNEECECSSIYDIRPPEVHDYGSVFSEFISFYDLSVTERLILMLAVLPHVCPQLLDVFFTRNLLRDRGNTEFGGIKGTAHSGFLPTGETAAFLIAGNDLGKRFNVQQYFDADHVFKIHNILWLGPSPSNEPVLSGQLLINDEYIDLFTGGKLRKPSFSMDFPAKRIATTLDWEDLVLDRHTMQQLNEIKIWLKHGHTLMNEWDMKRSLKPGYKALFHGPPGTGKTLTAGLFGKLSGVDVYRVDLSMVISKYIGETEKNLEKVFTKAEHKNWILFFDEADSLFGKRTSISDAHDKYANQEIAYLLQRLEEYNGLVILSSNMRNNVDEAFGRRLQSIIHFPIPKSQERSVLWRQTFSDKTELETALEIDLIAERYELAGGSIINVVQYASLMALHRNETIIREKDVLEGIKKEFRKEGKTI